MHTSRLAAAGALKAAVESIYTDGVDVNGTTVYQPYILARSASGWILPACAALSTVSQSGTTVTFTNAVATAHNIPASTYDGYQVYFLGHPSGQGSLSSGTMTPVYLAVDTTAAKNITFTMSPATASDYVVLEGYHVEVMPS